MCDTSKFGVDRLVLRSSAGGIGRAFGDQFIEAAGISQEKLEILAFAVVWIKAHQFIQALACLGDIALA